MSNGTTTKIGTMGRIGSSQALRRQALILLGLSGGEETSTAIGGTLEQHRSECDGKLQKIYF